MNRNLVTIGTVSLALVEVMLSSRIAESRVQTASQIIADARTPISTLPYTINKSGSFYLTRNLTGSSGQNGITITADDVTLDLNGFTLKGVPGAMTGISMTGVRSGIRIHSGTVRDWANGIVGVMANNTQLNANVVNNTGVGVKVADGFVGIPPDSDGGGSCIAMNGGNGVELGANGTMSAAHVMNNGGTEVVAGAGLSMYECKLDAGGGTALTAGDSFEIRDSTLMGAVTLDSFGLASGNTFRLSGAETITFGDNNKITGSHFSWMNASGSGPALTLGTGNLFERNLGDPWAYPKSCIFLITGPDNQITHNHIVATGGLGATAALLIESARNVVAHNTIHVAIPAGSAAIKVSGDANSIVGNTIRGDGVASINGVQLLSNNNVVIQNTFGMLMGAPLNDQGTGNLKGPIIDAAGVSTATNPAAQWRP